MVEVITNWTLWDQKREGAHEGGGLVVLKYSEFMLNLSEFKLKTPEF